MLHPPHDLEGCHSHGLEEFWEEASLYPLAQRVGLHLPSAWTPGGRIWIQTQTLDTQTFDLVIRTCWDPCHPGLWVWHSSEHWGPLWDSWEDPRGLRHLKSHTALFLNTTQRRNSASLPWLCPTISQTLYFCAEQIRSCGGDWVVDWEIETALKEGNLTWWIKNP